MGVSTASVSRLLQKARALGIVKIEVMDMTSPEEVTLDLIDALGLKRAAVVEAPLPASSERWPRRSAP